MIKFLIKHTIKDNDNVHDNKIRNKYNLLGGILGIICNLFLFVLKIVCGIFLGSIAIISDAFNNFSDMGSSVITIIGSKMSNLKPDRNHPFGHGRFEYIASFIVSFIIIYFGIQLLKESINVIINPTEIVFNWVIFAILCLSLLVKIWMYSYNKYMGNKINSQMLIATSKDSLNDVISTSAVILSLLPSNYINFPFDGIIGVIVSLLILKSGFDIGKDTISLLLGQKPSKELVDEITKIVKSEKEVLGVHDLLIHDYGPGRVFASCHAEVSDKSSIIEAHEVIDKIEKEIEEKLGILISIHMDPITLDNPILNESKEEVNKLISQYEGTSAHDFRIVNGKKNINIIFDLIVPFDATDEYKKDLLNLINNKLKEIDNRINPIIKVEHSFID